MEYEGVTVHELPPNGQGLAALIALNILSELDGVDLKSLGHNSAARLAEGLLDSGRLTEHGQGRWPGTVSPSSVLASDSGLAASAPPRGRLGQRC